MICGIVGAANMGQFIFKGIMLMLDLSNAKIVKRGICFYDSSVEYEVIIVESDTLYGSGDYEDTPEIAEDREVTCFYVWYEDLSRKGVFNAGGGGFLSIDETIASVEKTSSVKWQSE